MCLRVAAVTDIESRIEIPGYREPRYDKGQLKPRHSEGRVVTQTEVARKFVGGRWDEMGKLQSDFLIDQGLKPEHQFLDVGCGSLRAGVRLVDYLKPGNYYGIDINPEVIRVGYDDELTDEQRDRLPSTNLHATDRFDADFGVKFDMAIAQSVFTHVSLNYVRLCLYRVAKVMAPGARFFATFNERPKHFPVDGTRGKRYTERNVYWYYRQDLRWAARFSPWEFRYIGDWGHSRGQMMVEFTRRSDD
jgi:SAM-dependent methyltransferase